MIMSKSARTWIAMILLGSLVGLSAAQCSPDRRVRRYVEAHRDALQAAADLHFEQGEHLSYSGEFLAVNDWPGRHPMVEYLLFTTGPGYYGFYYSPDDVPLSFQNTDCLLSETATGWQWQSESGNHGSTRRISPCWYYFEAFF